MLSEKYIKQKKDYKYFDHVDTRFGDNDVFGHVNNVIYYAMFDTVINRFLIHQCGYDPVHSKIIGISPETRCIFRRSFKFPDVISAGLSVQKLGHSSVIYDISLFLESDDAAIAEGHFVHVFVNRYLTTKTATIPEKIRRELKYLQK